MRVLYVIEQFSHSYPWKQLLESSMGVDGAVMFKLFHARHSPGIVQIPDSRINLEKQQVINKFKFRLPRSIARSINLKSQTRCQAWHKNLYLPT